jgi:hypothetical protein
MTSIKQKKVTLQGTTNIVIPRNVVPFVGLQSYRNYAWFEVLFLHLPGVEEENHQNVCQNSGTSRIQGNLLGIQLYILPRESAPVLFL